MEELLEKGIITLASSIDREPDSELKRKQQYELRAFLKKFKEDVENERKSVGTYDVEGVILNTFIPETKHFLEEMLKRSAEEGLARERAVLTGTEAVDRQTITDEEKAARAELQGRIAGSIKANIKAEKAALSTAHLAGVTKPVTHARRAVIEESKNTKHFFDKSEPPATKFTEDAPPLMPPRSRM